MSGEKRLRFFLDGAEVSEDEARAAEDAGQAKLCGGASGGRGAPQEIPLTDAWMALESVSGAAS